MKAEIGDYIQIDNFVSEIISIDVYDECEEEYLLANGHAVSNTEITIDNILLPSEVI